MKIFSFGHSLIKTHAINKFWFGINLYWKFNNPTVEHFWTSILDTIRVFTTWSIHRTNIVYLKVFNSIDRTKIGLSYLKFIFTSPWKPLTECAVENTTKFWFEISLKAFFSSPWWTSEVGVSRAIDMSSMNIKSPIFRIWSHLLGLSRGWWHQLYVYWLVEIIGALVNLKPHLKVDDILAEYSMKNQTIRYPHMTLMEL